jgi:ParB family chromosome partitioning protein
MAKFVNILCNSIIPNPNQPRKSFDDDSIQELSLSIKHQGILQPIVVKWLEQQQKYQIIAGERRWRAAKTIGLESIPAIIKNLSESEQALIAIIENIQRAELTSIEEAHAFNRLKEEFQLTHEQIAEQVGKSRSHITNLLRLLNLTQPVQDMLTNKQIDMGHARALLSQDYAQQISLANMVVQKNMSVRDIESYIKSNTNFYIQAKDNNKIENFNKNNTRIDKDLENLQNNLEQALGAIVQIKATTTKSGVQLGKGSIIIKYDSLDTLDGILSKILSNA